MTSNWKVIDIFCGVGGLTHGFFLEGFDVIAGFDADEACKHAYETNNGRAIFIKKKIEDITTQEIKDLYSKACVKILVGCAPCQPYSRYTQKKVDRNEKWRLLSDFANLICEVEPDIVSMENVPELVNFNGGVIYRNFVRRLKSKNYDVSEYTEVFCPDYGIPQHRKRLVLFASRHGKVEIIERTHTPDLYQTVKETIGHLRQIAAGQVDDHDPLHRASVLSDLNLRRIKASLPGGSWRDWPEELVAECHKKRTGKHYSSVYGRMSWNEPSPTITTQFYGFGNGRFGHPSEDRAISLREAALLQTFPENYQFFPQGTPYYIKTTGRLIGNAVPVELGRIIAKSIRRHLEQRLIQ